MPESLRAQDVFYVLNARFLGITFIASGNAEIAKVSF